MFDTDWITAIVVLLAYTGGYLWARMLYKSKDEATQSYEFTWKCPRKRCTFEVASNDKSTTGYIAEGHMKYEQSKQ